MTNTTDPTDPNDPADSGENPAARRRRGFNSGPRSVKRSLASIVLGFETIVVFLAALVTYGLDTLPPVVALGGGAVLCLLMVALIGLLRFSWSYPVGWALQALIIATGFITPAMFFVGALFAAMWTYCMINGNRIDNQKEPS
ncbi:DUF4233 domain-containing protein [Cryobacterium sp. CG_9.6]|uniref:DUF4233 domain-containing protein n=1 Tax=Cryobacterium sp. CG_9.6 TaxID=2760710 RepID=UPI0024734925|nr:DUF4233 domain-containing protein [Cryobacterium sp. CG_9.6]MDH6237392.1 hypothetical protein [Cryobacterium sp. CG_9.6]